MFKYYFVFSFCKDVLQTFNIIHKKYMNIRQQNLFIMDFIRDVYKCRRVLENFETGNKKLHYMFMTAF